MNSYEAPRRPLGRIKIKRPVSTSSGNHNSRLLALTRHEIPLKIPRDKWIRFFARSISNWSELIRSGQVTNL